MSTERAPRLRHLMERIRVQDRPGRFLVSRILWRTGICSLLPIRISLTEETVIRFRPSSMAANLWVDPAHYDSATAFLRSFLRQGDTFVDVGANIGVHSLLAAQIVGTNGTVIGVEPHPRSFAHFQENLALNGAQWVTAHRVAAGDKRSRTTITTLRNDDENALLDGPGARPVDVIPLDDLVPREATVDLLKVDVDGYETAVLRGATKTLDRTRCVIFEAADGYPQRYGYTLGDVWAELQDKGFSILRVTEGDRLTRAPEPFKGMREDPLATRDVDWVAARAGFRPF